MEGNIVQNSNLEILDNAIRDLALVIEGTGKEVADALETVQRISQDARSGNEALSIMGHSINKIFESSTQVMVLFRQSFLKSMKLHRKIHRQLNKLQRHQNRWLKW